MNNLDDIFIWWCKRYNDKIKAFFKTGTRASFYSPSDSLDDTILDIIDMPRKMFLENSQIFKAMMYNDFFGLFKKLKEYFQPLHEEWKRGKNEKK